MSRCFTLPTTPVKPPSKPPKAFGEAPASAGCTGRGREWIRPAPAAAPQQTEDVSLADRWSLMPICTPLLRGSALPPERDKLSLMNCHLRSAVAPGTRLVVAMVTAVHHGIGFSVGFRFDGCQRIDGNPPRCSPRVRACLFGVLRPTYRANPNGFDTLMIANSYRASPSE
jgi:hypothetical protein